MRFIIVLLLHVSLFASFYNFDEYKYIKAVDVEFKKSGHIETNKNKTIITYTKPNYKQIIKEDDNISIKDFDGQIYTLKGNAKYFTKLFIGITIRLGEFSELKTNQDFNVKKDKNEYTLTFKGEISNQILTAIVKTKNQKVTSFKMFMVNEDTLKIVKR